MKLTNSRLGKAEGNVVINYEDITFRKKDDPNQPGFQTTPVLTDSHLQCGMLTEQDADMDEEEEAKTSLLLQSD